MLYSWAVARMALIATTSTAGEMKVTTLAKMLVNIPPTKGKDWTAVADRVRAMAARRKSPASDPVTFRKPTTKPRIASTQATQVALKNSPARTASTSPAINAQRPIDRLLIVKPSFGLQDINLLVVQMGPIIMKCLWKSNNPGCDILLATAKSTAVARGDPMTAVQAG